MQGAKERRLSRINNTTQGEASEGNAADDALMVDQGDFLLPEAQRRKRDLHGCRESRSRTVIMRIVRRHS
jgi:hypothetical protein